MRLGLSQTALGEAGGVTKKSQMLYESGERSPDASYLAAISSAGVDVSYVLTGGSGQPSTAPLSEDERLLLHYYREAEPAVRKAALGALLGIADRGMRIGGEFSQHATGDGSIQIGHVKKTANRLKPIPDKRQGHDFPSHGGGVYNPKRVS